MIRVQRLFESPFATVDRVDHPADVPHVDPPEERSDRLTINFIERGEFHVAHAGGTLTLDRDALFVTTPGQINRYSHSAGDCAPDDVVLAIGFGRLDDDEMMATAASRLSTRAPLVPLSNRRAYLRHRLLSHLEDGADAIALDSIAGELLHATVAADGRRRFRPSQVSWYARRVDAARRLLDDDYASRHTLTVPGRAERKNRPLLGSDHAGGRDGREGMFRQEGLYPVYAQAVEQFPDGVFWVPLPALRRSATPPSWSSRSELRSAPPTT